MRLLEKLLTGKWYSMVSQPTKNIQSLLGKAFAVDTQNIWNWYQSMYGDEEYVVRPGPRPELKTVAPIFKLPFPNMWLEFEENRFGKKIEFGVLLTEDIIMNKDSYAIVNAFLFMRMGDERYPICRYNVGIAVNEDFEPISLTKIYFSKEEFENEANAELTTAISYGLLYPCLSAIAFFHCKNVSYHKVYRPEKLAKKLSKRYSISLPSFHVIEVHKSMSKKQVVSERDDDSSSPKTARIIRGHFKRYEGEHKLFGRLNGIWFWDMQVQGAGIPLKSEYRTWPPEGKHEKKCLVKL